MSWRHIHDLVLVAKGRVVQDAFAHMSDAQIDAWVNCQANDGALGLAYRQGLRDLAFVLSAGQLGRIHRCMNADARSMLEDQVYRFASERTACKFARLVEFRKAVEANDAQQIATVLAAHRSVINQTARLLHADERRQLIQRVDRDWLKFELGEGGSMRALWAVEAPRFTSTIGARVTGGVMGAVGGAPIAQELCSAAAIPLPSLRPVCWAGMLISFAFGGQQLMFEVFNQGRSPEDYLNNE